MSNLKEAAQNVVSAVEKNLSVGAKVVIGLVVTVGLLYGLNAWLNAPTYTDPTHSSVMITNLAGNSGGSGVVLASSPQLSTVLTNAHICKVVVNGGRVSNASGEHTVTLYQVSEIHDLCLITVSGNLKAAAKIASSTPEAYIEEASISGHPSLYPNVVTKGHYSGNMIIEVMIGSTLCSKEEMEKDLSCAFFGIKPLIKSYESSLVTATIMGGSSGSGVFNSKGELTNLVFAGSGKLSYAFTVPFAHVQQFLFLEVPNLRKNTPNYLNSAKPEALGDSYTQGLETILEACNSKTSKDKTIQSICRSAQRSTLYRGDNVRKN